jgi:hypothetical protein
MMPRILAAVLTGMVIIAACPVRARAEGAWLDQNPPAQWNRPGMALPTAEAHDTELLPGRWCSEAARSPETEEDRTVAAAGWFLMGGYAAGWGVRIVGGNAAFDGMCRPVGYQYFVFVDGTFAGTLSPEIMNSRFDGAGTRPSVDAADRLAADFVRYAPSDALCCPSGRSVAFYQVERTDDGPVVLLWLVISQDVATRSSSS